MLFASDYRSLSQAFAYKKCTPLGLLWHGIYLTVNLLDSSCIKKEHVWSFSRTLSCSFEGLSVSPAASAWPSEKP